LVRRLDTDFDTDFDFDTDAPHSRLEGGTQRSPLPRCWVRHLHFSTTEWTVASKSNNRRHEKGYHKKFGIPWNVENSWRFWLVRYPCARAPSLKAMSASASDHNP